MKLLLARNSIPSAHQVLLYRTGAGKYYKTLVLRSVFLYLSFTERSTCYLNLFLLCLAWRIFEAGLNVFCSSLWGLFLSQLLFSHPSGGCLCMHFSLPRFTPKLYHLTFDFGFVPSKRLTSPPGVRAKWSRKVVIENRCYILSIALLD